MALRGTDPESFITDHTLEYEKKTFRTPLASVVRTTRMDFKDFRTENGSSQSQNLVVTGLFVPNSLDSGLSRFSSEVDCVAPGSQSENRQPAGLRQR